MKKLFAIVAAIAALSFTACGNKTENTAECDSTCAEKCVCDSCECDPCECNKETCCAEAPTTAALAAAVEAQDASTLQTKIEEFKAYIQKLIDEGKAEEAAKYAEQLKQFVAENKEKIAAFTAGNETVSTLVNKVAEMPTDVAALASALGVQAKDAAVDAKDAVVGAANDASQAAQQKVEDVKNDAAQKANEAVEAGKQKAGEAIDNAAADVKGKLGL